MDIQSAIQVPEQGQLVRLRQRFWLVQDIVADTLSDHTRPLTHRILLECLDDDRLGDTLDIIWEREIHPQVFDSQGLPEPHQWSTASLFDAFITAIRWSSSSLLERQSIQAPFHAAIDIEEYQLEPVVRALTMPRANLLIADDVGLGKTIEAGLVVQEMLSRRKIRRILVVCPASLQQQWHDEMRDKFQLNFEIINREQMQRLRREYGMHVNPWASYPRLITSMDFVKREQPLRQFRESLQQDASPIREWDLLIVDEAHNAAPAGRSEYAVDSDRTRMLREITEAFEHRLFLTATPHNGFTESFTALLELLDPLRFSRGPEIDREEVNKIMIRRLKDDITDSLGVRKFAEREVAAQEIKLSSEETELHDLLNAYTESRLSRLDWQHSLAVRFALTMLKKRLLSSPLAFQNSLRTHFDTLGVSTDEGEPDLELLEQMTQRVDEDWADDTEKAQRENDALIESTRFFSELNRDERNWLETMYRSASSDDLPDTKLEALVDWIDGHLKDGRSWNNERLIVFTEYKDTLDYLRDSLIDQYGEERVITLMGGMSTGDREQIKAAFQTSPDEEPARILVATDAASEGLNLQNHCRYLIHYEIPWNPNRMEQRNGRIDRHGQTADMVYIYHYLYSDRADSRFLETVVDKVQTMREDLGSVGDIIATQVEEAMLGKRRDIELPEERQQVAREFLRQDVMSQNQLRTISRQMNRARETLSIYPETLAMVLDQALQVIGHPGLEDTTTEGVYRLRNVPDAWRNAARSLYNPAGQLMSITFEHDLARNRRDLVLLHLNHPLMKRAMGVFRKRLWDDAAVTMQEPLHRTSYRIVSDTHLDDPVIIAFGRLVANGAYNQRLHEEVVAVGGDIDSNTIYGWDEADLRDVLKLEYEYKPISVELGNQLRKLYRQGHQKILEHLLSEREAEEQERLSSLAQQRADEDAEALDNLMGERIKELEARIKKGAAKAPPSGQLELFDLDEFLLYQDELIRWYRTKQQQLRERRQTEPDRIREAYQLRSVRIFPLGLLYLLPERLVEQYS